MSFTRRTVAALAGAAAVGSVNAAMGPAFSTGPTSADTYIKESWATLVLPEAPSDNQGDLSLWVGMGTSNGDLVQSISDNYQSKEWSNYAYTLKKTGPMSQFPIQTEGKNAKAGDHVTIHYEYSDSTQNYTQTVLINNVEAATLSTSDGHAQGWGSAVECAETNCGTVPAHKWINVTITLSGPDPDYIQTLGLGEGVDGHMTTKDGGRTWNVGTISIPSYSFTTGSVVRAKKQGKSANRWSA